jgi:nucleotide-binding universal stress UspA family protein
MIQIRKVLYPTDFSSYSNQAYFHAVAQAEIHNASLTIVYVFTPGAAENSQGKEANRQYWREQLESIRPTNPNIPVNHVFLEGDPATEIIRYARDAGIDLICMGTHGRTGLERMLMGSVAERVLRDGPCSTLVVKLPKGNPGPAQPDAELIAAR